MIQHKCPKCGYQFKPRKTEREKTFEQRYQKDEGCYTFVVTNSYPSLNLNREVEYETIEEVLHKVKLDLMTLTHHQGLRDSEIKIKVKVNEDRIPDGQHRVKQ